MKYREKRVRTGDLWIKSAYPALPLMIRFIIDARSGSIFSIDQYLDGTILYEVCTRLLWCDVHEDDAAYPEELGWMLLDRQ